MDKHTVMYEKTVVVKKPITAPLLVDTVLAICRPGSGTDAYCSNMISFLACPESRALGAVS